MALSRLLSILIAIQIVFSFSQNAHANSFYEDDDDGYDEFEDESVYYTRHDVLKCGNTGRNVAIGIGVGILTGLIAGRGRMTPAVPILGLTGGIIGGALSCREKVRYIEHVDYHLRDRDYRQPYRSGGIEVVVLRSGLNRSRQVCRTYVSRIQSARGVVTETKTACWMNGGWRHGYRNSIIIEERYRHPRYRSVSYSSRSDRFDREYREESPRRHFYAQ